MNALVYVAIAAAIWAGGFWSGWTVDTWKHKAERLAEVQAAQHDTALAEAAAREARAARDLIAGELATKLGKLRIVNQTITQEVRHEIEKPVYVDPRCAIPPTGVRLLNAAVDAANGTARPDPGKPAQTVPGVAAATRGPPATDGGIVRVRDRDGAAIRRVLEGAPSVDRRGESDPALAALNLSN